MHSMDTRKAPVAFSSIRDVSLKAAQGGNLASSLDNLSIAWQTDDLPILRLASNTLELLKQNRLVILLWAGGHPALS